MRKSNISKLTYRKLLRNIESLKNQIQKLNEEIGRCILLIY